MKHTKGTRTAAVAATLLAAGLVAVAPATAAETQGTTRITSIEQLHASILAAVKADDAGCGAAALSAQPMGGWPPDAVAR